LACAENPIVESSAIRLTLPRSGAARLAVYDASGRRVRLLLDRSLPGGDHRLTWDGRDRYDRPAPGGRYYLSLRAGSESIARSVLLIR